jgi:ubiquinone/menaquinone biosynthesis C-methylase UbiE
MFDPNGPTIFELARQALSSTTRGYDLLAPKFEHTPFRTPDEILEPMMRIIEKGGPVESALDACCGTGAGMRQLRKVATSRVVGVDLSQGMLDQAESWLDGSPGDAELEFIQGDALDLQFDEEFDVAISVGAFGHILEPDQDAFILGLHRALRPGGRFVFVSRSMPSPADPGWWVARGFNAAMHVRNALIDPPFIMFYLTFTLERATEVLWRHGFEVRAHEAFAGTRLSPLRVVVATKS